MFSVPSPIVCRVSTFAVKVKTKSLVRTWPAAQNEGHATALLTTVRLRCFRFV